MRKAFSMLELVFVILIVGILAIAISPKLNDNRLRELAHQIISDLRYTQHLAMQDNKFDVSDSEWHLKRWQIYFHNDGDGKGHKVYTVWRDENKGGGVDTNEIAIDQTSRRRMTGDMNYATSFIEAMDLTKEYGVVNYNLCGNATKKRLYFDYLGRVYAPLGLISSTNRFDGLLSSNCNLTLTNDKNQKVVITILAETGYAYISHVDD